MGNSLFFYWIEPYPIILLKIIVRGPVLFLFSDRKFFQNILSQFLTVVNIKKGAVSGCFQNMVNNILYIFSSHFLNPETMIENSGAK